MLSDSMFLLEKVRLTLALNVAHKTSVQVLKCLLGLMCPETLCVSSEFSTLIEQDCPSDICGYNGWSPMIVNDL